MKFVVEQTYEKIASQPLYYVQLPEGILAALRLLDQYADMPFFINRLRLVNTSVQGLNRTVPYLVLYYSLLLSVDQRRYTDATDLVQPATKAFRAGLSFPFEYHSGQSQKVV